MPAKKTTLDANKTWQEMVVQPEADPTQYTVPFATRIPKPLIKRLNLYRVQKDTTVQEVVRLALEQYLDENE